MEEFARKQLPEKKPLEDILSNLDSISLAYGIESGYTLMKSVDVQYRKFALQMKSDLEKEYQCTTISEMSLIDQVVLSYTRKICFSELLERRKIQGSANNGVTGYLSFLSKEIDRAHRQFLSSLEALRSLKQPTLSVNIRTQNAFVGENQQFNNHKEQNNELN